MILHLPSTLNTSFSLERREADNRASNNIPSVLLKLTTDLEGERFIWKKQGKPKYLVMAISQNLCFERDRKDGFETSSAIDFPSEGRVLTGCWGL